jgi:hypothetical protein
MEAHDYVEQLLRCYAELPETPDRPTPEDLALAHGLHRRGVPLRRLQVAMLFASARRLRRNPEYPPLRPIRSLAYFLPVLDDPELDEALDSDFVLYLRYAVFGEEGWK